MIDVLEILEKRKDDLMSVASSDDFGCRTAGEADASLLADDPTVSLYCFDQTARCALFVQVPEGVDITDGPFLYIEQYEHAQRILSVPYELFHQIAAGIELSAPLVLIHSTGRAGSTLLSKAVAEMEAVTSLSEPDVYTQAVAMRLSGGDDEEIRDLLTSATRLLLRPGFTRGSTLNVVKFRSWCIEVADLLTAAFPQAGNLFLYRDLDEYVMSAGRAFGVDERSLDFRHGTDAWLATLTPLLGEELKRRTDLDGFEVLALMWLSTMHTHARLHGEGLPMLAVRYEELKANPLPTLEMILAYLGLPTDRARSALPAFERDFQAGSLLSQEEARGHAVWMDAQRWNLVRDLVQRYPIPGTDISAASLAVP